MKIEIWSDYVCPFCYIGKRRLEEALKATDFKGSAEVVFKAFQLDPNTPVGTGGSVPEGLAEKYGISLEEAKKMLDNVAVQAKTVGLDFDVDSMTGANTFDAHRLAKLGEQEGKGAAITERLLQGHFVKGEAVDNKETLAAIAGEAGLSAERVQQVLQSDEFAKDVKRDIQEAGQIGVRGVPFFVINRKYAISGAQPVEAFTEALKKVVAEEKN
ncbi:DsbA family oxidoreductase [Sporosarcina koreensis]|uniref:DsbA family oxidoreductase n=1 Tax=Sporosarcina koreensis TaxID=334735 RepID=A0ABW0TUH8_9BACL